MALKDENGSPAFLTHSPGRQQRAGEPSAYEKQLEEALRRVSAQMTTRGSVRVPKYTSLLSVQEYATMLPHQLHPAILMELCLIQDEARQ